MFGRFGMVIVLVAVLACMGLLNGTGTVVLAMNANMFAGAVIMIIALILYMISGKIAGRFRENVRERAYIIARLGALVLCGIGAIVVFCG